MGKDNQSEEKNKQLPKLSVTAFCVTMNFIHMMYVWKAGILYVITESDTVL